MTLKDLVESIGEELSSIAEPMYKLQTKAMKKNFAENVYGRKHI